MSSPADVRTARFGGGLATEPDLVAAAGSAVTQALGPLGGERPDLLAVFVSGEDADQVEAAGRCAMEQAGAVAAIGCSAGGVIGADQGVENQPAVSVFAACLPGVRVTPFHLQPQRTDQGAAVTGMPQPGEDDAVAVLLTDPATFPVAAFLAGANEDLPGLPFVGGVASGFHYSGAARLFLDGESLQSGAVGVLLGGALTARTVVSQGCRPFGPPMVVTKAQGNIVLELAGMPALAKLEQIVGGLSPADRIAVARGLHIGIAMDEYADEHERGDFLVRAVVGADRERAALAIGDVVEVGRTVRFQARDAETAGADLSALLAADRAEHGAAGGALLFSCNGRGAAMFPSADHDVVAVRSGLDITGVAGFFAAGEIGPVGGRNHFHGFTASVLAFGAAPSETS